MSDNEDILAYDPDSMSIEADDTAQYEPDSESQVVAIEPLIITVGRKKRRDALREMPKQD